MVYLSIQDFFSYFSDHEYRLLSSVPPGLFILSSFFVLMMANHLHIPSWHQRVKEHLVRHSSSPRLPASFLQVLFHVFLLNSLSPPISAPVFLAFFLTLLLSVHLPPPQGGEIPLEFLSRHESVSFFSSSLSHFPTLHPPSPRQWDSTRLPISLPWLCSISSLASPTSSLQRLSVGER